MVHQLVEEMVVKKVVRMDLLSVASMESLLVAPKVLKKVDQLGVQLVA
jgi:hypothetical protein